MIVRASSLAMRFYQKDGWTEEILKSCLNGPDKKLKTWPNDELNYWIADSWNCFNLDLLADRVTAFQTFERKIVTDTKQIRELLEDNNL